MKTQDRRTAVNRSKRAVRHGPARAGLLAALMLAVSQAPLQAQADSFEELAGPYLGSNAQGFFGPLAKVLSGNLNNGFIAPVPPSRGFSLRLGLTAPSALISDGQRSFRATTGEDFTPSTTADAPTVVGSYEAKVVEGEGGTAFIFPGGMDVNRITLAVPQLTIGTLMGTEATLRFVAVPVSDDIGDLSLLGAGVRHNVSQYLPNLPVTVGVGAMYNTLRIGDDLDMSVMLVTLQASRRVRFLDVYGGLGWENATVDLSYDSEQAASGRTTIELDGVNGMRGTAGVALALPLITLNADFTIGSQTVFGLGLSFGSRY